MTEQPRTCKSHTRPRWRKFLLWGAIGAAGTIVLLVVFTAIALKSYRIPSSAMEPTLNCAKPSFGCLGDSSDHVLACDICGDLGWSPSRGDIVVFKTPPAALRACGEGGTFVKRVIGLPGETVREGHAGFIWIRGPDSPRWTWLKEPYVSAHARHLDAGHFGQEWAVPKGRYFMVGDNRSESCDSRQWGSVPAANLIEPLVFRWWPLSRLGFL